MVTIMENQKHIGFVIANDREEYLNSFEDTRGYTLKTWASLPDFACVFSTAIEARKVLNRLRKHPGQGGVCYVLELWDFGTEWMVSTQKPIKPKWLNPIEFA